MPTKKPLIDLVPQIIQHFNEYREHLNYDHRVFKVYEGQIKAEIEDSLRRETISKAGLARSLQRIPPVNILKKATDKLSKLYDESVVRHTENTQDQEIQKSVDRSLQTDTAMLLGNRMMNAQNRSALEPYVENGKQRCRVLAAHQFLPFSDDPVNPLVPTVFIKIMGSEVIKATATDASGNDLKQENSLTEVNVLALYSDKEFLVIDTSGQIRPDWMESMGSPDGVNPFGEIPFIYLNKSDFQLVPFVNQSGLDISILIPKLLTDLNYAVQFMSHSIIWVKNTDLDGAEAHPDSVINLGSNEKDEHDADIGTIDPKVDVEKVLQLVQFELSAYLSTIGIKSSNIGSLMPGREASGISKFIDEGDASSEQKTQAQKFKTWEIQFWSKLAKMQKVWVSQGLVEESRIFSEQFIPTLTIHYKESAPFKTDKDKAEEIEILRNNKLISQKESLRRLNPTWTAKQIEDLIAEIKAESEEELNSMAIIAGRMGEPNPEGIQEPVKEEPKE